MQRLDSSALRFSRQATGRIKAIRQGAASVRQLEILARPPRRFETEATPVEAGPDFEALRWFILPSDVAEATAAHG